MNTRVLMRASALVQGALGVAATFLPDELLAAMGAPAMPALSVALQLLGATCLGLAMLDWMVQGNLMGGIYGRPVVVCNLTHFTVGGLALLKRAASTRDAATIGLAASYAILAIGFGYVMRTHPVRPADPVS